MRMIDNEMSPDALVKLLRLQDTINKALLQSISALEAKILQLERKMELRR